MGSSSKEIFEASNHEIQDAPNLRILDYRVPESMLTLWAKVEPLVKEDNKHLVPMPTADPRGEISSIVSNYTMHQTRLYNPLTLRS